MFMKRILCCNGRMHNLKLFLHEVYSNFWIKLMKYYGLFHERMCGQHVAQPTSQEWVGLYKSVEDTMPEWVGCAKYLENCNFGPVEFGAQFMGTFHESTMGCNTLPLLRCNLMQGSKVLLLLVTICPLFLGWALFLESSRFCVGSPKVTHTFLLQVNVFQNCAQNNSKIKLCCNHNY